MVRSIRGVWTFATLSGVRACTDWELPNEIQNSTARDSLKLTHVAFALKTLMSDKQMARKLNLAGAIILIPTAGGKQIAFAVLISSLCLYVSLRLNPYVDEKLEKLHITSLTAQCVTLFYALLLELQAVTNSTFLDCSSGTCERAISDLVMDYMLTLMQVSIFMLPAYLFAKSGGLFGALAARMRTVLKRIQETTGLWRSEGRLEWPPLQAPAHVFGSITRNVQDEQDSSEARKTRKMADAVAIQV